MPPNRSSTKLERRGEPPYEGNLRLQAKAMPPPVGNRPSANDRQPPSYRYADMVQDQSGFTLPADSAPVSKKQQHRWPHAIDWRPPPIRHADIVRDQSGVARPFDSNPPPNVAEQQHQQQQPRPRYSDDDKQWYVSDVQNPDGGHQLEWKYTGPHGMMPSGSQAAADMPHPQAWELGQLRAIGIDTVPEHSDLEPDHPFQIQKRLDAGRKFLKARVERWLDEVESWRVRPQGGNSSLPSYGGQGVWRSEPLDTIPQRSSVKRMFAKERPVSAGTEEDPICLD